MKSVDFSRPGDWQVLLPHALRLMAHLESETDSPVWTFGGGTVLMLRLAHRLSKDIDLFVDDPQYLGYINPRLSDVAESISTDYEENAEFIKLRLTHGEIDVVVGSSLTPNPFETVSYGDRSIRVETCSEILAKKMWHRGNRAKVRDLFDLWSIATMEPEAIAAAAPFMQKHGRAFLDAFANPTALQRSDLDQIETLGLRPTLEECVKVASAVISPLLEPPAPSLRRRRP
ncbi:nucleotidyl transferase AbiEii/AbiGii toxin family protein [Paucibacter soli]|uniref:nucleotidyl transferase AbiEii/AbiGii toxin family protein n=1 Tax=Paucibacter soli TaxID=3133433 RepID=UPI00309C4815